MTNNSHIPCLVLILLFSVSCSDKIFYNDKTEMDGSFIKFSSEIAKASASGSIPDGTTLRFILYSSNTLFYNSTGTYIYDSISDNKYLTPATLGNDGAFLEFNKNAGLNGIVGGYNVAAVSPGFQIIVQNSKAAVLVCPENPVYATDGVELINTFGEYADIKLKKNLYDIRSKIRFEVFKSQEMEEDLTVKKISLKGAGAGQDKNILYYPATCQCEVPEESGDIMDFNITEIQEKSHFITDTKYILSCIYAPREETANILNMQAINQVILDKEYLSLQLSFQQGAREVYSTILLNADSSKDLAKLKPYHEYVFKVEISSTYINLYLTINNWQIPTGNNSSTISNETNIFVGKFPIRDWINSDCGGEIIIN